MEYNSIKNLVLVTNNELKKSKVFKKRSLTCLFVVVSGARE